jgi:amino acid adenylation domain-containing protein
MMEHIVADKYWWKQLAGIQPATSLLPDAGGSEITARLEIPAGITTAIAGITGGAPVGRYTFWLAVIQLLISRYTAGQDIVVGTAAFHLKPTDTDNNLLLLRNNVTADLTVKQLLEGCRQTVLNAYTHQRYSPEELENQLRINRGVAINELFTTAFLDENIQVMHPQLHACDLRFVLEKNTDAATGLAFLITCRSAAGHTLLMQLGRHLLEMGAQCLHNTGGLTGHLSLVKEEEAIAFLQAQQTVIAYDAMPVTQCLEQAALLHPQQTAVYCGDTPYTYEATVANMYAWHTFLVKEKNLLKGNVVAIAAAPGTTMLWSMLGVLRAGGIVLLIEPSLPLQRIAYILENSKVALLITTVPALQPSFDNVVLYDETTQQAIRQLEPIHAADIAPDEVAILIYTSGSTGKPRATGITHRNLCHHFTWFREYFQFQPGDVLPQKTIVTFVDALLEILFPITHGHSAVYLQPREGISRDEAALGEWLTAIGTTIMQFVPSVFDHFTAVYPIEHIPTLRKLILSGEPLKRLYDYNFETYNIYGCSECCASSTIYPLQNGLQLGRIPIGRPIGNTCVYILDNALQLQPPYVSGDIYISGDNTGAGYIFEAAPLERFIDHPWFPGERWYKTGDTGRLLPDGTLLYEGRKDEQLKIRGQLINLAEVNMALLQLEGVTAAIAFTKTTGNGEVLLLAAIAGQHHFTEEERRQQLSAVLPAYMIPARWLLLERMPLNVNGKTDRQVLLDLAGTGSITPGTPARNEQDAALLQMWEELLLVENIGIRDDFFQLGGHSLKATRLLLRIQRILGVKLQLQEIFEHATVEQLSDLITTRKSKPVAAIMPLAQQPYYLLSHAQQRMWILNKLEGSTAYVLPGSFELRGNVQKDLLQQALHLLIARHEILRTVFPLVNDVPRQQILDVAQGSLQLAFNDVREDPQKETIAHELAMTDAATPFDLETGPLLRARLIQLADDRFLFVLVIHHIIADAWSGRIIVSGLFNSYNVLQAGETVMELPLSIQYKDYAAWQQQLLQDNGLDLHRKYWQTQLSGTIPAIQLPADFTRPAVKSVAGESVLVTFDQHVMQQLMMLGKTAGATPFMTLLSALYTFLYRYTAQEDLIVGTVISGRDHPDLENQIGFYVNALALRCHIQPQGNFASLLSNVRDGCLRAYAHQLYPFDKLVEELQLSRDTSRSPLFDVVMTLNHTTPQPGDMSGITVTDGPLITQVCEYDLKFNFYESEGAYALQLDYNTSLFEKNTVERWLMHFNQLLSAIVTAADTALCQLDFLSKTEREQLAAFNDTAADFPLHKPVTVLFGEAVMEHPEHSAIVFGDTTLTYKQLDHIAAKIAAFLLDTLAVQSNDRVAVMMPHSDWLVASMLGILQSGAAYVPIDAGYPEERIRFMLEDAGAKALLVSGPLNIDIAVPVIDVTQCVHHDIIVTLPAQQPDQLAYVVYTSGSTGRPKGVMITHAALVNLCYWHIRAFGVDAGTRTTLYAGIGFDACGWEIWPALLGGGCLFPLKPETRLNLPQLAAFFTENAITHCFLPTVICEQIMELASALPPQLLILTGGDRLHKMHPAMRIVNNYGPSESTVVATSVMLRPETMKHIPIGRPVSNVQVLILGPGGMPQPVGIDGELFIGGKSLALGYLHNEVLTAERFITDAVTGERLYRTGDTGRWLPDGNILFKGRTDAQIKMLGYRIEPGEIVAALLQDQNIQDAVVVAINMAGNEKQLVAYFTAAAPIAAGKLRSHLSRLLPVYMVPAHFIQLDTLPVTPNGKVNLQALPAPQPEGEEADSAPVTSMEKSLALLWQKLLGRQHIGLYTGFFEAGGNSLLLIAMHRELTAVYGTGLQVTDLFKFNTIKALSIYLEQNADPVMEGIDI